MDQVGARLAHLAPADATPRRSPADRGRRRHPARVSGPSGCTSTRPTTAPKRSTSSVIASGVSSTAASGCPTCSGRPCSPDPGIAASPYRRTVILPKVRDPRFITDPPRRDSHGRRPSAPRAVGGRVRGARAAPLRVGAARRPAAPPGDRADPGLGARRDHDVAVPRGGRPCHGGGAGAERSGSARRIRCRPGRGRRARRRARAGCCRLRDQGGARGGPGSESGERRPARVPMAARHSSRTPSANSSSTISACATRSAGRCSADP